MQEKCSFLHRTNVPAPDNVQLFEKSYGCYIVIF